MDLVSEGIQIKIFYMNFNLSIQINKIFFKYKNNFFFTQNLPDTTLGESTEPIRNIFWL